MDHPDNTPELNDTPDASGSQFAKPNVRSLRLYQGLAAAMTAIAAFFIWQSMSVPAEMAALQLEVNNCAKRRERTDNLVAFIRDTDTHPVKLTDGKNYQITIFHNKLRKACALDLSGLPIPSAGKYFQCWAAVEGQAPTSMGMVEMDSPAGWQPLEYIEQATVFSISEDENPAGDPTPGFVIATGKLDID